MPMIYHQIQGLYTAGDVMVAIAAVRALPDYHHTFFINHEEGWDTRVHKILTDLGVAVRRSAIVTKHDLRDDLQAIFYHCVGHDDSRRGEYVRFWEQPGNVRLFAWLHTPGLCGTVIERYNFLHERPSIHLIFDSTFGLHNTPGIDRNAYAGCTVIYPSVETDHWGSIRRRQDETFRLGRWSRGHDSKYSDDFLALMASIDIPDSEFLCMGIPGKFRGVSLPPNVRMLENGAVPVEALLARLDVLLFKTHAPTWHEGWCRTVTEAMAAGVVPVAENRGGLVDQIIHGYNGFLCETNDDFKRYCELLYHDPALRARMSANARCYVQEHLSLAHLREDLLKLLKPGDTQRLNYGCGLDVRPGYLNFDIVPLPGVDVSAPVDPFYPRLPFADEEFDEIIAFHVLEHVANKPAMINEIWRVARHNARIKIKLPDRHHSDAFVDPTHLSFWEVDTIDFYLPGHMRSYYSPAKFALMRKHTTGREIYWELLAMRRRPTLSAESTHRPGNGDPR